MTKCYVVKDWHDNIKGFLNEADARAWAEADGSVYTVLIDKIDTDILSYDEVGGELVLVSIETLINNHRLKIGFEVQLSGERDCPDCLVIASEKGDEAHKTFPHNIVIEAINDCTSTSITDIARTVYKQEIRKKLEDERQWTLVDRDLQSAVGNFAYEYLVIEKSNDGMYRAYISVDGYINPFDYVAKPDFGIRWYDEEGDIVDEWGNTTDLPLYIDKFVQKGVRRKL